MLCLNVDLGQIVNRPLCFIFAQVANQIFDLSFCQVVGDHISNALFTTHLSELFEFCNFLLRLVLVTIAVRVSGQERILLSVSDVLAPGPELCPLLELSFLFEVSGQAIERGLIAVLHEGLELLHVPRQHVVDWRLRPVVDHHSELQVKLAESLVLLIVAKLVLTSLDASCFLGRRRPSTFSHENRL